MANNSETYSDKRGWLFILGGLLFGAVGIISLNHSYNDPNSVGVDIGSPFLILTGIFLISIGLFRLIKK